MFGFNFNLIKIKKKSLIKFVEDTELDDEDIDKLRPCNLHRKLCFYIVVVIKFEMKKK